MFIYIIFHYSSSVIVCIWVWKRYLSLIHSVCFCFFLTLKSIRLLNFLTLDKDNLGNTKYTFQIINISLCKIANLFSYELTSINLFNATFTRHTKAWIPNGFIASRNHLNISFQPPSRWLKFIIKHSSKMKKKTLQKKPLSIRKRPKTKKKMKVRLSFAKNILYPQNVWGNNLWNDKTEVKPFLENHQLFKLTQLF